MFFPVPIPLRANQSVHSLFADNIVTVRCGLQRSKIILKKFLCFRGFIKIFLTFTPLLRLEIGICRTNMKKILITLVAALTVLTPIQCASRKKTVDSGKIVALVNGLQAESDAAGGAGERDRVRLPGIKIVSDNHLDIVSIGGVGLSLAKWAVRHDDDVDVAALAAIDGVRRLMIVSYEDCPAQLKSRFDRKIQNTLDGCDLLMEAKGDGDSMSIFGDLSADGSRIGDIVMYSPTGSALICIFGTISADALGTLAASVE